jgi:hypothetical protein
MTVGDPGDMTSRLVALLPGGWFPAVAPRLNAVLQGWSNGLSAAFSLLAFVKAQERVGTAQGGFLDLAARDFFGSRVTRLVYEADTAYRARIKFNLTAPRGTWTGMVDMLTQLTGTAPSITQPNAAWQTGGICSLANPSAGGGALAVASLASPGSGAGFIGTLLMPCTVFITVTMPSTGFQVFANINGIGYLSSDARLLQQQAAAALGGGGGIASLGSPTAGGGRVAMVDPNSIPAEITTEFLTDQINDWLPAGYAATVTFH